MKFKINLSSDKPVYAEGYPATDKVDARVIKKKGAVVLKNGENVFFIDDMNYKKVTVKSEDDGSYSLVGCHYVTNSQTIELARFGSAKGAHAALKKFAALSMDRGSIRWLRLGIMLVIAYVVLNIAFSLVEGFKREAAIASSIGGTQQFQQQNPLEALPQQFQSWAPVNSSATTANEIERLAAGGPYQFNPKITQPELKVPDLNCAKK